MVEYGERNPMIFGCLTNWCSFSIDSGRNMNRSVPSTVDTTWEGGFSLIGFGNGLAGLMFTIHLRLNHPVFGAFPFTSLSTYRLKVGIILTNRVCSFDVTHFRQHLTILKPNIACKLTILRKRNLSICKARSNTAFQTSSSSALRRSNNLRKIKNFRFEVFVPRKSASDTISLYVKLKQTVLWFATARPTTLSAYNSIAIPMELLLGLGMVLVEISPRIY